MLLNANVALLAIQSVDDGGSNGIRTPVQISSYLSIAMSIGSIILGLLLVRQNRTKGKESAPEAVSSVCFIKAHCCSHGFNLLIDEVHEQTFFGNTGHPLQPSIRSPHVGVSPSLLLQRAMLMIIHLGC